MTPYIVDVETDGAYPPHYSMISFGAVRLDAELRDTFYAELAPISNFYDLEALAVTGFNRRDTERFNDPKLEMYRFANWLERTGDGVPIFYSDNLGFDWQFINYYFCHFLDTNPFGHNGVDVSSLYKGMVKDIRSRFDHLCLTPHDHNPVNDAMGIAEALLYMQEMMGMTI
jgi:hypothetical protein